MPADKGEVELEVKHGHNEMLGQGRASGFTEVIEMPVPERRGCWRGEQVWRREKGKARLR